jgi:hypothetical protein
MPEGFFFVFAKIEIFPQSNRYSLKKVIEAKKASASPHRLIRGGLKDPQDFLYNTRKTFTRQPKPVQSVYT